MIKKADRVCYLILLAFLFLTTSVAIAQDSNSPRFTENKGQWPDQVAYKLRVSNADIYFEKDRLTFDFLKVNLTHDHENETKELTEGRFAYSVQFIGSNENVKTVSNGTYGDYQNYFLGSDPAHWASNVRSFTKMSYVDLYPGINLNYYEKNGHLKYDVVVAPNVSPSTFKMKFDGVQSTKLRSGKLIVSNPLNTVTELAPVAYQVINGKKVEVACQFKLKNNVVSFELPNGYDLTKELVIDPTLIFASYTGSTANNFGFTATYDDAGSLYGGGLVYGMGYPFVTGSFQEIFGGARDIGISKFTPDGSNLVYSTFIGGSNVEIPNSMVVNSQGELVVLATTGSLDFPLPGSAVDATYNGGVAVNYASNGTDFTQGTDIAIVVLSADGTAMIGGTYLGGTANDGLNMDSELLFNYGDQFRGEVIIDNQDNIYIASSTLSSDLPTTSGVLSSSLGGSQDGCLAKYNSNLSSLIWCSYFGGLQADASYSVKLNQAQELYITGGTRSSDLSVDGGALYSNFQGGNADGYVARISNDGTTLINSSFIGTSGFDQSYFVEVDEDQDVYLYGQSLGNYPVNGGVYSNAGSAQFIQKLPADLSSSVMSTVFGSGGSGINISPTAFLVDVCDRIYISGWGGTTNLAGGNTNGMPLTNDAEQSTTDGSDFYFAVFEADASNLLYGTYFGGSNTAEHVDGGTSRFDRNGVIYQAVCAACGNGNDFPVTPGAWSEIDGSGSGCNLGVIKLDMELGSVNVEISNNGPLEGCSPYVVDFGSIVINASSFTWDFGDGTPGSSVADPTHTFSNPGTYLVTLIGADTSFCAGGQFSDTATIQIIVNESLINANAGTDAFACSGVAVAIGAPAVAGVVYSWSPAIGLNNSDIAQPQASPAVETQYILTTTDANGCEDQDTVIVGVFSIEVGEDASVCQGESIQLSVTGGSTWVWSPSTFLSDPNAQNPVATMSSTTTFTVLSDNGLGCQATDQVTITINPLPTVNAGVDQTVCANDSVQLNASGGIVYSWTPGAGLSNSGISNPFAFPASNTLYEVLVTDANGCQNTDQISITVEPAPTANAGADNSLCAGDTVQLNATGGVSYSWSPAIGLNNPNIDNPIAFPITETVYSVTVLSANGCDDTDQITVTVNALPAANAGADIAVCFGETVQLNAQGGISYTWLPTTALNNPNISDPVSNTISDIIYEVLVTDVNGCEATDQVEVTVNPLPTASAGTDVSVCQGDSIQLNAGGGTVYSWSPGASLSNSNIADPLAFPSSDTEYEVLVTDANGCRDEDTITVMVLPPPVVIASQDTMICLGDSVQLGVTGAVTYLWSPLTGLIDPNDQPLAAPTIPITYVVVGEDANGCKATDSVRVDIFSITAGPDTTLCVGDSVQVFVEGGVSYQWSPVESVSDPTSSQPFLYAGSDTEFEVIATSDRGCVDQATVTLATLDPPVADFSASSVPSCDGVEISFENRSQNALSYFWDFGDGTTDSTFNSIHEYPAGNGPVVFLIATNNDGLCADTFELDMTDQLLGMDTLRVSLGNVITPNFDGYNDCFQPLFDGSYSNCYELVVYNRWGNLLFESVAGTGHCWDGRTKAGTPVSKGTYYFIVRINDFEKAGWVAVVE